MTLYRVFLRLLGQWLPGLVQTCYRPFDKRRFDKNCRCTTFTNGWLGFRDNDVRWLVFAQAYQHSWYSKKKPAIWISSSFWQKYLFGTICRSVSNETARFTGLMLSAWCWPNAYDMEKRTAFLGSSVAPPNSICSDTYSLQKLFLETFWGPRTVYYGRWFWRGKKPEALSDSQCWGDLDSDEKNAFLCGPDWICE